MKLRTMLRALPLLLLGFAAPAQAKDPQLLSLSREHFKDTATVTTDSPDIVTISTEKGFMEHTGLMRMVWNDEFLQATIDQKTGRKNYQVVAFITYSGSWRSYESADYPTDNARRTVPVTLIKKEAANCAVGDCTYTERIAFPIEEALLRRLATDYVAGGPALWQSKFIAKSGPDFSTALSTAEIAGLIAKVDDYTHALPSLKANAATAALKADFGIAGLAIPAAAESPSRAGVLITAVNSGSVAQKAGLLIGDIVYEFGGHPAATPADLQAAIAGAAANSVAAVKLFRGTERMTLSAKF